MPVFTVKCFDGPIPTGDEPTLIEAPNAQIAAESVCDAPLADVGAPWSLRARSLEVFADAVRTLRDLCDCTS